MPPPRKRGAMGRAVMEQTEETKEFSRRSRALLARQRLAQMSDEEAKRRETMHTGPSAKLLMSGLKLDPHIGASLASKPSSRPKKTDCQEPSTHIVQRGASKKKLGVGMVSESAKVRMRKGKK